MSFGGGKTVTIPSEGTYQENPVVFYKQRTGLYPNNTQIWWSMKRPPEAGTDRPPVNYLEVFDPGLRHQVSVGNTPAPKGHFILNALFQDRSATSGLAGLATKTSSGIGPNSICFYAGRVFYSGVYSNGFSTKIYFSQIIQTAEQVSQCFQEQDPTAEDLRDLLPSDGGVLVIPEIDQVHHMMVVGSALIVFASNGIWQISGSGNSGFLANDYSVAKISGVSSFSKMSFVDAEGIPFWWSRSSINSLQPTEQGMLRATSLTDATIQSLYLNIPEQSRRNAKGFYDPIEKTIKYLYRKEATATQENYYDYDSILVLDTRTGSWSPWEFADHPRVTVKGVFSLVADAVELQIDQVVAQGNPIVNGADRVVTSRTVRTASDSTIKYIVDVSQPQVGDTFLLTGLTFAEEYIGDKVDWSSITPGGSPFDCYVEAGYSVLGESNKNFQSNYVTVNYENIPGSAWYIQGAWDYSENGATGRWSMQQRIMAKGGDYQHGFSKVKIRGSGKALQIRIEAYQNSPFKINGWAVYVTSDTQV